MTLRSVRGEIDFDTPYEEIDRIQGNLLYLKGHPHPHKGIPSIPALEAVNKIKKGIFTMSAQRMFETIEPHLSRPCTPFTDEMQLLLIHLMSARKAVAIAHIFEFDAAYRFRLQDLLTESSVHALTHYPIDEILRLLQLNKERDYPQVHNKFKVFALALVVLLVWPPTRRRFIKAIQASDFTQFQFDEGDRYWARRKTDYRYGGGSI